MNQQPQATSRLGRSNSRFKFLDCFIPDIISNNVAESFKARTLILIVGILVLLASVSMTLVISIDKAVPERRLITITLIALQTLAIFLMRLTRRTKEAAWYIVSLLAITVMYIDYNNASFIGAYSITWILPTTTAVMLLGGSAALKVTLVAIVGMTINFVLLKQGALPLPITDPSKWVNVEFIISISIMLIVTFSVYALSQIAKQKELELSTEIESRKRIAKELEDAKDVAEKAAENKSMFLATMSHELRTPLNSILGNAELLSREHLEGKTKARVNDIFSAGQLLISIINDVLDLSKLDTYGIELNNDVYNISEQLKHIHRMMDSKVKPGVTFKLAGVDKAIFINADQNRISQIILNLVTNALKFTEQGEVTLSLICQADAIIIEVQDTGVGISNDDARNLFQDFVQVRKHANRQIEGTGLGLAIIQRIAQKMSGTIKLDSQEGKGSTFTVELPISTLEAENIAEDDKPKADHEVSGYDFAQLNLLIVDDVPMNCIILKALLEELGVDNIVEEHDGADAVERIRQDSAFDMVLMDVRMPKMDGLEATKLIRELGYNKPIIAVTANAFEEDKRSCLDAGMTGFLSKPIEIHKLIDALQQNVLTKKP